MKIKVIKKEYVDRVNVDTTVQKKAIVYPTHIKLYYKGIRNLGGYAKKRKIKLKQTYERVGKSSLLMYTIYMDSRKMKKAMKEVKKLKTYILKNLKNKKCMNIKIFN